MKHVLPFRGKTDPAINRPTVGLKNHASSKHCLKSVAKVKVPLTCVQKQKCEAYIRNRKPVDFPIEIFRRNGYSEEEVHSIAAEKLVERTYGLVIRNWNPEAFEAVRSNNLEALKKLVSSGADLECYNRSGDSLIHIACRRGHTEILKYLVYEAGVSVNTVDTLNRTPLHDAFWTSEPNFEIVETLLRMAPEQAICADQRGHTPLDYARKQHLKIWLRFLLQRCSLFHPKR